VITVSTAHLVRPWYNCCHVHDNKLLFSHCLGLSTLHYDIQEKTTED